MTHKYIDKYRFQNAEVAYSEDELVEVQRADLEVLIEHSSHNPRKRVRLCAHRDPKQPLHEMLIIHERSAYVRPHRHPGKSESMHVIAGLVDVVIFDQGGNISRVIKMGDYVSGNVFYYRMATPLFHALLIRSEILVFHETTDGPFKDGSSEFPHWAPDGMDTSLSERYVRDLDKRIKSTIGIL